jgi:hypothetical protein
VYKRPASVFPKTQRPCTISMTREDMYHFLKADEVRYRSEWKNPPLLMLYFNPHGERRRNSSKYPLHDKEAREHAETARLLKQQQEQSAPPQTVYYKQVLPMFQVSGSLCSTWIRRVDNVWLHIKWTSN